MIFPAKIVLDGTLAKIANRQRNMKVKRAKKVNKQEKIHTERAGMKSVQRDNREGFSEWGLKEYK
jgi:hypothetical protein